MDGRLTSWEKTRLGSSRTVTDTSASATATATTDAFGLAVTNSGTTASAYKYGTTSG